MNTPVYIHVTSPMSKLWRTLPEEQQQHGAQPRHGGQHRAQQHPGAPLQDLLVPEQEEGRHVPDQARGLQYGPEYARVPRDGGRVGVARQKCSLNTAQGVVTVTAEMTVVADLGSPDDGASEAEQHGGEVDSDGVEVEVLGHLYSTVQYNTVQYSTRCCGGGTGTPGTRRRRRPAPWTSGGRASARGAGPASWRSSRCRR